MVAQVTRHSHLRVEVESHVALGLELFHPLAEDDSGLHDIGHGDAIGAGRDHVCNGVEFASLLVRLLDPHAISLGFGFGDTDELKVLVAVEDTIGVGVSGVELLVDGSHLLVSPFGVVLALGHHLEGASLLFFGCMFFPHVDFLLAKGAKLGSDFGIHIVVRWVVFCDKELFIKKRPWDAPFILRFSQRIVPRVKIS